MSPDIRDWLEALSAVSSILTIYSFWRGCSRSRLRRRERFRSFKGFGVEWTTYDSDDDAKS